MGCTPIIRTKKASHLRSFFYYRTIMKYSIPYIVFSKLQQIESKYKIEYN